MLFWQTKSQTQPVQADARPAEMFEEQAFGRLKGCTYLGQSTMRYLVYLRSDLRLVSTGCLCFMGLD